MQQAKHPPPLSRGYVPGSLASPLYVLDVQHWACFVNRLLFAPAVARHPQQLRSLAECRSPACRLPAWQVPATADTTCPLHVVFRTVFQACDMPYLYPAVVSITLTRTLTQKPSIPTQHTHNLFAKEQAIQKTVFVTCFQRGVISSFVMVSLSSSFKLPACSTSPLPLSTTSRKHVVSNVIAPQKLHSSQPQTAQHQPVLSKQQQSPSQWGWVNLNGLKLQWPSSSTVDPQQQPQHEVSVERKPLHLIAT